MNDVPFLDVGATYHELRAEIDDAVARVLRSGWYIGGPEVESFESDFAEYVGASYCIGCGNGLDALTLALRALGVGPGDEVIVPANTFIATWLAVSQVGAVPVPVEPDTMTYNLDPTGLEAAISPLTKAILVVHLYGLPAELETINRIAAAKGIPVIEDAAQAHGAIYRGVRIGGRGNLTTWSFYPGKNLGAFGDAGAITTDDESLAGQLRLLRNYGSEQKYLHLRKGTNSRLDPLQAAILRVKLRHLDRWNQRRSVIAQHYMDELAGENIQLPHVPRHMAPSWHLFVVQLDERDKVQNAMAARNIATLVHYPIPPHMQAAYPELGGTGRWPRTEQMSRRVLSLPIGPHLSIDEAASVVEALRTTLAGPLVDREARSS